MDKPGVKKRMTAAAIRQRRMAPVKHGRRAEVVTQDEVTRYRLEKIDPDAPELIEKYTRAIGGDLSELDSLVAAGMASKEIIRRKLVEEIGARGVIIEEVFVGEDGKILGRKIKANPVLDHLKHTDEQLGLTAEQAQLSRKSRGAGAVDAALAARLLHNARLRAYRAEQVAAGNEDLGLPALDPEVFRPIEKDS